MSENVEEDYFDKARAHVNYQPPYQVAINEVWLIILKDDCCHATSESELDKEYASCIRLDFCNSFLISKVELLDKDASLHTLPMIIEELSLRVVVNLHFG
jgi:hypothetical protein